MIKYTRPRHARHINSNPSSSYLPPPPSRLSCDARSIGRTILAWIEQFQRFCWKHKIWFSLIWGLIVAFPPLVIVSQFTNEPFSKDFTKNWPWIAEELAKAPVQWTLVAGVWVSLTTLANRLLASLVSQSPSEWAKAPGQMLVALDDVVARKTERFERLFQQFSQEKKISSGRRRKAGSSIQSNAPIVDARRIFESITLPEAQIDRLAEAIYATFENLTRRPDDQMEQTVLTLALVRGLQVETIFTCLPTAHRLPADAAHRLSDSRSCLMLAARSQKLQVVQSTFDERERASGSYIDIQDSTDAKDGSTVCYPVRLCESGSQIVISIYYPRRDAYLRRHQEIYENVLARFGSRLRLEYSLLVLKGLCT